MEFGGGFLGLRQKAREQRAGSHISRILHERTDIALGKGEGKTGEVGDGHVPNLDAVATIDVTLLGRQAAA